MDYELYQNTNRQNSCYGRWFARAVHEPVLFKELCRHVAVHSRTLDVGTIVAVMTALEAEVRDLLLDGRSVQLGELGSLSLTLDSASVERASDFRPERDVKGVRLRIYPGRALQTARLRQDMTLRQHKRNASERHP